MNYFNKELFIPKWPVYNRTVKGATTSKSKQSESFPFSAQKKKYFYFGRNALWWGIKALKLQEGDTVLVPAYCNDLVYQTFRAQNINVKFFDLTEQLEVTVDTLKQHLDTSIKAVVLVHYFGWVQSSIEDIKIFCKENNLFLIEDCALTPTSRTERGLVGSWGDISIFSLKKYWAVPNGGLLVVNNPDVSLSDIPVHTHSAHNQFLEYISQKISALFVRSIAVYKILGYGITMAKFLVKRLHTIPTGSSILDIEHINLGISNISKKYISESDSEYIRKIRRENYIYLQELLTLKSREPFVLHDGVNPLCYPLIVTKGRDILVDILRNSGIGAGAWWNDQNQGQQPDIFPHAQYWKNTLVTLPIHQSLGKKQMEFISKAIAYAVEHNDITLH